MKKHNFKKMALLGMAGGMMISAQGQVNAEAVTSSEAHLNHSCGANSCSHSKGQHSCANKANSCANKANSCANKGGAPQQYTADSDKNIQVEVRTKPAMTESDLMSQLNDDAKKTYMGMDAEGKAMALRMASQQSDKNAAVKAAARQMAEKRAQMTK